MSHGPAGAARRLLATALMRRDDRTPVRTKAAYRPPPPVAAKVRPVVAGFYRGNDAVRADLLVNWPDIVGRKLAAISEPIKVTSGRGLINNGCLTIQIAGPEVVEIQHQETQLLERINYYIGYKAAVGRLRYVQAPLEHTQGEAPSAKPASRNPSPADETRSAELADCVKDDGLRATLVRLGAHILAGRKPMA